MMESSLLWRVSLITVGWKSGTVIGISRREDTWVGWFGNLGGVKCCLLSWWVCTGLRFGCSFSLENWQMPGQAKKAFCRVGSRFSGIDLRLGRRLEGVGGYTSGGVGCAWLRLATTDGAWGYFPPCKLPSSTTDTYCSLQC